METKSAIGGGLAALAAVGIAFGGFAVANADTTPAPEPSSIVVTTEAPAPVQEPVVTTPAPEPTTEAPAPVAEPVAPVVEAPAPVVVEPAPVEPAPVYVQPAPVAPAPVYVAPAPVAPAPVVVEPAPTQAPLYKGADGYYYAPDIPNAGSGPKIGRAG